MVQKLRSSTGVFFRSALVLVGWVFFALAQVTPEPLLKLVFASIARVLPNALACTPSSTRAMPVVGATPRPTETTRSPEAERDAGCALA